jgi:hypothetical protein
VPSDDRPASVDRSTRSLSNITHQSVEVYFCNHTIVSVTDWVPEDISCHTAFISSHTNSDTFDSE